MRGFMPSKLSVVSLNLGDNTSNPLESFLAGYDSAAGLQATDLRQTAEDAMNDEKCGPAAMDASERAQVTESGRWLRGVAISYGQHLACGLASAVICYLGTAAFSMTWSHLAKS